jgi:hypothetical protein
MGLLVGFTGTRHGMTPKQVSALIELLIDKDVAEFHHGDCHGSDAEADRIACGLGIKRYAHPPTNEKLRAFCEAEVVLTPEEYKARDRAIVLATGSLLACPRTAKEQKFGGTWYTIGFARQRGRPVVIVLPDGRIVKERTHGWW